MKQVIIVEQSLVEFRKAVQLLMDLEYHIVVGTTTIDFPPPDKMNYQYVVCTCVVEK